MAAKKVNVQEAWDLIKSEPLVLVDAFATWCGPCKMLLPVIDELADETQDVNIVKIDVDENNDRIKEFDVSTIPAVILYKGGKEVDRFTGFKTKDVIIKWINENK